MLLKKHARREQNTTIGGGGRLGKQRTIPTIP